VPDTQVAASSLPSATSHDRSAWPLWAAGLVLTAIYAPTVIWLFGRWTLSVWHHAHGMLIPPVVAYVCWQTLKDFDGPPVAPSAPGWVFVLPALALHVLDTALHTQLLSAISLVVMMPGLSLLLLGRARTLAIAFPLAFLAFMLPIPLAATERMHLALRHVAADASARLVPLLGIPAYVEGTTIHLTRATLEVADACSGFSTLYAAMAVAFLTAYSVRSWTRRVAVIVLAAPIAIAANIVRVVLLVGFVQWQGTDVLATSLHTISGMFTFVLALPLIFWIGRDPEPR
jgi:exosortase